MVEIVNPFKPWWPGDSRVEPFMLTLSDELHKTKHGLSQESRTTIYNRAYEAVYAAICKYDNKREAQDGR